MFGSVNINNINNNYNNITIEEQISINYNDQKKIKYEIDMLKELLIEKEIEGYLLQSKIKGISLLASDNNIGKYKFLTEKLKLPNLGITMYPLWLNMCCTYPKWSQDILSLNLICGDESGEETEILIDGFYNLSKKHNLNWSYNKILKLIKKHDIIIPMFYCIDYKNNSNIQINFTLSEPIEIYEHNMKDYLIKYTNDDDMMINSVKIKFILIISN